MITNERGQELHSRATLGKELTSEERAELVSWYSSLDAEEARLLKAMAEDSQTEELQKKIDEALARIAASSNRIRTLNRENEGLRP